MYTSLKFSNDGKWLLVGTSSDTHYVVDAFEGVLVARLEGLFLSVPKLIAGEPLICFEQSGTVPSGIMGLERSIVPPYERPMEPAVGISSEELSWTPDGRYIISGTPINMPSTHLSTNSLVSLV